MLHCLMVLDLVYVPRIRILVKLLQFFSGHVTILATDQIGCPLSFTIQDQAEILINLFSVNEQ